MVRRPVLADQSRAIQAQDYRQVEQRRVVYNIVIRPLCKGCVNVAKGLQSLFRHTGRERHSMALRNAHIKSPIRHFAHQDVHRAACRHCRRDADDFFIGARKLKQRFSKHVLKLRGLLCRTFAQAFAAFRVKFARCVPNRRRLFRRFESFALYCVQVEQLWPFHLLDLAQRFDQLDDVVSICRPEIADIHPLKDVLLIRDERFYGIVESQYLLLLRIIEHPPAHQSARKAEAQIIICGRRVQALQILLHTAHTAVDAHIIIVEDDQQIIRRVRRVVKSLKGQSAAHRPIADDGYDMAIVLPLFYCRDGHTECRRYRIARMATSKSIVRAFFGRRKGANAAILAVRMKGFSTAGENLMSISLMPRIPYDAIRRRSKDVV